MRGIREASDDRTPGKSPSRSWCTICPGRSSNWWRTSCWPVRNAETNKKKRIRIKVNFLYPWPWIICHRIKKEKESREDYQEDEKHFFPLLLGIGNFIVLPRECHGCSTRRRPPHHRQVQPFELTRSNGAFSLSLSLSLSFSVKEIMIKRQYKRPIFFSHERRHRKEEEDDDETLKKRSAKKLRSR